MRLCDDTFDDDHELRIMRRIYYTFRKLLNTFFHVIDTFF